MTNKFILTFFIVFCLTSCRDSVIGQEAMRNEELLQRFMQEAPQAWEKQRQLNERYSGLRRGYVSTVEAKGKILGSKIFPIDTTVTQKILDSHHKSTIISPGTSVSCINPDYFFELSRSSVTSGWVLGQVVPLKDSVNEKMELSELFLKYPGIKTLNSFPVGDNEEKYLSLRYNFSGPKEKSNIFDLENINFLKCYQLKYLGVECIAVEFQFGREVSFENRKVGLQPSVCFAILNPNSFWAVLYMKCQFNRLAMNGPPVDPGLPEMRFEVEQEFEQGYSGGARLIRSVLREWNASVSDDCIELVINNTFYQETLRPENFYLTAYGLPEPDWYTPPKPWWFYTSIVGMVLVVVGAVVFHFGKRLWREGSAKQNNKKRR
ncbi:MAG: hypothetical protein KF851_14150 [Pirellulaceae bacterium]|nr:hypothetical protein [Pirellulaceae bacterium]